MFEAALLLQPREEAPHARRGGGAAVRRGVHALRGGGGIAATSPCPSSPPPRSGSSGGRCRTSRRRTTRSTSPGRRPSRPTCSRGRSRRSRTTRRSGLVAFDAFPPRLRGRDAVGRPGAAQGARSCSKSTGVAFVRVAMSPLAYIPEATAFTRGWSAALPPGPPSRVRRDRRADPVPVIGRARRSPTLAPHPARARALRVLRRRTGPVDEATGRELLELYGVRRPKGGGRPPRRRGPAPRPARSVPGRGEGARARSSRTRRGWAGSASASPTRRTWRSPRPRCSRRRGGPARAAPKVLVQEMVRGTEVLVGAVVDDRFGAMLTMRPGGALAEAGAASFVPCPLTPAQARAYVEDAGGALRPRPGAARPPGGRARGRGRSPAPPTTCGGGSRPSRRTRCSSTSAAPWPWTRSPKRGPRDLRARRGPRLGDSPTSAGRWRAGASGAWPRSSWRRGSARSS